MLRGGLLPAARLVYLHLAATLRDPAQDNENGASADGWELTRAGSFEVEDTCGTEMARYYGLRVQSWAFTVLGAMLSPVCPLRHHQRAPAVGAEGLSL